ncbi:MAG: tRNA (adenosine(37)-N6)-threonylcarbamoyltransferase complex dimerization subunit type 1 TsaB [Trueperaceae bacterium]
MTRPRLGIDTATPFLSLALWWPVEARTVRRSERVGRDLGARLVPAVAAFLEEHGVAVEDLAGIGVGVGPGSYTGARVGVAFALGLARARSLRVVGGDSAAARAAAALPDGGAGWVAMETRRATALASRWSRTGDAMARLEELGAHPFAELPPDAIASLEVAPDAARHARAVDEHGARAPLVRYG